MKTIFNQTTLNHPEPQKYQYLWSIKIGSFIEKKKMELKHLQDQVNNLFQAPYNDHYKKNLAQYIQHQNQQLKKLEKIQKQISPKVEFAISELLGVAVEQGVAMYDELIVQDWIEHENCNHLYTEFIQNNIDQPDNAILLGVGSGGLGYQLAQAFPETKWDMLDSHPYLLHYTDEIYSGREVKVFDFSLNPKYQQNFSAIHKVKKEKLTNVNLLWGDFFNIELPKYDTIIAPWFFDILPLDITHNLPYALSFLKAGGKLIYIGPINFNKDAIIQKRTLQDYENYLSSLCVDYTLEVKTLPYLNLSSFAASRLEDVAFITITKTEEIPFEKPHKQIITKDFKIPFNQFIETKKAEQMVFGVVYSELKPGMSIEDLAKVCAPKLELDYITCEQYLVDYFRFHQGQLL